MVFIPADAAPKDCLDIIIGKSHVEIEEKITREWYEQAEEWSCDCGYCRNFLKLAREKRLPDYVLELLDRLGIMPEKATYVCELFPKDGGHLYQISYRVAGRILSEENEVWEMDSDVMCYHESYPGSPEFSGHHFDLGFAITLPWVLEENDV